MNVYPKPVVKIEQAKLVVTLGQIKAGAPSLEF